MGFGRNIGIAGTFSRWSMYEHGDSTPQKFLLINLYYPHDFPLEPKPYPLTDTLLPLVSLTRTVRV